MIERSRSLLRQRGARRPRAAPAGEQRSLSRGSDGLSRAIRASRTGPSSLPAAAPASAPRSPNASSIRVRTCAFVDIDDEASRKLCADLKSQYRREPLFINCDIRDIARLAQGHRRRRSRQLGPFSVLVNNAANDMRHSWREVEPDYWDDRMAINLRPLFFTIQAIAPMMEKLGGGSIINFGSISWKIASGGMPAYVAAKAADPWPDPRHGARSRPGRHPGEHGVCPAGS